MSEQSEQYVINRFNPGGIEATLRRWYADESLHDKWVVYYGAGVYLSDKPLEPGRECVSCTGLVRELNSCLREGAHLSIWDWLNMRDDESTWP